MQEKSSTLIKIHSRVWGTPPQQNATAPVVGRFGARGARQCCSMGSSIRRQGGGVPRRERVRPGRGARHQAARGRGKVGESGAEGEDMWISDGESVDPRREHSRIFLSCEKNKDASQK